MIKPENGRIKVKIMEVSPASRLAGDFLVSCQPAGRRPKSLLPAGYWNTDKEMAFAWHCDIKL